MIKVGLLDKNELFRESLNFLIDFKTEMEVHFSSNCFDELRLKLSPGVIDVLLVDIFNLKPAEKDILKEVIHHFPEVKVIILTDAISNELVKEFLTFRIAGYYSKSIKVSELSRIVKKMTKSSGIVKVELGNNVKDMLINEDYLQIEETVETDFFSRREVQILKLISKEYTSAEIAEKLKLSMRTVESHRRRMIERTQSKTIIGVLVHAFNTRSEALEEKKSSPPLKVINM